MGHEVRAVEHRQLCSGPGWAQQHKLGGAGTGLVAAVGLRVRSWPIWKGTKDRRQRRCACGRASCRVTETEGKWPVSKGEACGQCAISLTSAVTALTAGCALALLPHTEHG